jgi:hypothetical protein
MVDIGLAMQAITAASGAVSLFDKIADQVALYYQAASSSSTERAQNEDPARGRPDRLPRSRSS